MSLTPPDFSQMKMTAKSFWDRGEGKLGKGVLWALVAGAGAAGIFFWGLILPFLIGVVGNTVQLAMLLGVLAVLTSPLWSKTVHTYVTNAFQLAMRWAYLDLLRKDPIGILRNNVIMIQKQAQEFDEAVTKLSGSKESLEQDIQSNKDDAVHNESLIGAAQRQIETLTQKVSHQSGNDQLQTQLDIQGLQLSIQGYRQSQGINMQTVKSEQPILEETTKMYEGMCRIRQLAEFKAKSLTQQADMLSKRRKTMLAGKRGLVAATHILKGDPNQLALVDQTIEFLNNEATDTIGEMNDFNRWSAGYLRDMDLQNDANADEAEKMFKSLETKLLSVTSTANPIPDPTTTATATPQPALKERN